MNNSGYILITGAGSGLGKNLAIKFVQKGFYVALVGRTKSKLDQTSIECGGHNTMIINADVSKYAEVENSFRLANEWRGFPTIVISCAGEGVYGPVGSFSNEHIERVLSGSLIGTILVSQKAFSEMILKGGLIVNIMSTSALIGRVNESIYCASKWGAKGFTESLKLEAKNTKIKIIGVYPGAINTPFWNEKCGIIVDTSTFMDSDEVAQTLIDNLLNKNSLYVSDIVLSRKNS